MNNIKGNNLYQKGLETLNKIHGGHAGKSIIDDMQEISLIMHRWQLNGGLVRLLIVLG